MKAKICCVVVLSWVLSACTTDSAAPEAQPPSPTETFACPNQLETIEDAGSLVGESVDDDVDGDGTPDSISIHMDAEGGPGCQAYLTVETRGEHLSVPAWLIGAQGGLPQPQIKAIVDINSDGSKEIVLDEATGASTQFVGVYGISDGELVWLRSREQQGLFPFGGSVGHIEAVDCLTDGTIVVSMAVPAPNAEVPAQIYSVRRRIFSLSGGRLVPEMTEHHRISIQDLERFPEYQSSPFGNCPAN